MIRAIAWRPLRPGNVHSAEGWEDPSGAQGSSWTEAGHNPCGRELFCAIVRSK